MNHNFHHIESFPGYLFDTETEKVFSLFCPKHKGKIYEIKPMYNNFYRLTHAWLGRQLISVNGIKRKVSSKYVNPGKEILYQDNDKPLDALVYGSSDQTNREISLIDRIEKIANTVRSNIETTLLPDDVFHSSKSTSRMCVLPQPYEKYVYDKSSTKVYSTKSGNLTDIASYVDKNGIKFWQLTGSDYRYTAKRVTIDDITKFINENKTTTYEGETQSYLVQITAHNGEKFYREGTSIHVIEEKSLILLKAGYKVIVFTKHGEYDLVPERLMLKKFYK